MKTSSRIAPLLALALAVPILVAGCGGGGGSQSASGSAAAFVQDVTTEFSRGQSGRLWDELLPADQRVVTRARFVECAANEGWDLKHIKLLDTYDDPVNVGARTLSAKAVTLRVTSDDGVTTATMHAVRSGGAWRWVLQAADRRAYARGVCPRTS